MKFPGVFCLAVLLAPSALPADFPSSEWKYRAEVQAPETDPSGFVKITLPGWLLANAKQDLWDLRLVSQKGVEIPYGLRVAEARARQISLPVRILNQAIDPGRYEQIVCDLGENAEASNHLLLKTQSGDFVRKAELSGSADLTKWVVLLGDAYIFDQQEQGRRHQKLTLSYPDSSYRFLKVAVWFEGGPPIGLTGAEVMRFERIDVEPETVSARIVDRIEDTKRQASDFIVETSQANQHLEVCYLRVSGENFSRTVTVSYRDDRGAWIETGSGTIHRFRFGKTVDENLHVVVRDLNRRQFRIRVWNGASPPLDVTSVLMRRMPRMLVFSRSQGDRHTLFFGAGQAGRRDYDIGSAVQRLDLEKLPGLSLGPMSPNPAYRPVSEQKPWTERHPALIWAALGLGVLLLAGLLFRTVRDLREAH